VTEYHCRVQIQIEAPTDFDFFECVNAHGWRQLAPFTWDAQTRTLRRIEKLTATGPALLTVDENLVAEASEYADPLEVERKVKHMLQLDLSMVDFHDFCPAHSHLATIPIKKQGRLLRSPTLFEDLLKVIATTNTTWSQTKGMIARLVEGFGSPLFDGTAKAFPTAGQIACVCLEEFSSTVRMGYRAASVYTIATDIAEGRLDVEALDDPTIPVDELYRTLLTLPGVGPYAASSLMLYLGRYERVNSDSWARTLVGQELGIKATDKDVHDFFEPYGKWRALVYRFYPWRETQNSY
jgi:3-methyladenine DNA glycosylase/8-oxoguanine DNA glycosylase